MVKCERLIVPFLFVTLFFTPSINAQLRWMPFVNGSVFGGASQYETSQTRFRGSFDLEVAPGVELSPQWAILPVVRASYSGAQSAIRVVDEGTLLEQETEWGTEVSALFQPGGGWKHSFRAGSQWDFLRETDDEKWGEGLYDTQSLFAGMETERFFQGRRPTSLRAGVEASRIHYPNYRSLAAEAGQQALGDRLLDTDLISLLTRGETSLASTLLWRYGARASWIHYTDQKILELDNSVSGSDRQDLSGALSTGIDGRVRTGRSSLGLSLTLEWGERRSNQNYYDVPQRTLLESYYDYRWTGISPTVSWISPTGHWVAAWTSGISRRDYRNRPAQDVAGVYGTTPLWTCEITQAPQLTWEFHKHFQAVASITLVQATSNNDYEGLYQYQYKTNDYKLGLGFDF